MAKNSRPTGNKRARERAQQQRQTEKQARRLESKQRGKSEPLAAGNGGEDPDIAGITAGPQPRPDWLLEMDAEKEAAENTEETS